MQWAKYPENSEAKAQTPPLKGGVWAWTALFSMATVVAYVGERVKHVYQTVTILLKSSCRQRNVWKTDQVYWNNLRAGADIKKVGYETRSTRITSDTIIDDAATCSIQMGFSGLTFLYGLWFG